MSETHPEAAAFPIADLRVGDLGVIEGEPGLTKREYFAALAMQACLIREEAEFGDEVARDAVFMADELIKALNRPAEGKDGSQGEKDSVPTCRICGCTDEDCRQCVEKTGEPCHWVEDDLCSACA